MIRYFVIAIMRDEGWREFTYIVTCKFYSGNLTQQAKYSM